MTQNSTNSDKYTEDLGLENSLFNTGNIRSMVGLIVTEFYQNFQHLNE